MSERSHVQRATTYRVRDRDPDCSLCGEPIRDWHAFTVQEHDASGGVPLPVHVDCEDPGERQRGDPR